jgi:adhesin transport system outer membrane protein
MSLEDAVLLTQRTSPMLSAARSDIEAARHAVDVARGARWPQLNLVINNTRERVGGIPTTDRNMGLQANWSLFNGGSDFYAEKQSLDAVQAAEARRDELARTINLDVAQAWEGMAAARLRATQQGDQLRPAQSVLEANRELFRLGRRSILDILNAANDVHSVRMAQLDARYESWLRSLKLHVMTGRLINDLQITPPSLCAPNAIELPDSMLNSLPGF